MQNGKDPNTKLVLRPLCYRIKHLQTQLRIASTGKYPHVQVRCPSRGTGEKSKERSTQTESRKTLIVLFV